MRKYFKLSTFLYFLLAITGNGKILFAQTTNYNLADVVSIAKTSDNIYETWPEASAFVLRRTGGLKALTIDLEITGTAINGLDYLCFFGKSVTIPLGKREVWISLKPLADLLTEPTETIKLTVKTNLNYSISGPNYAEIQLLDKTTLPNDVESSRFLIQAGFGADPDELADVKALGFEAWIDQQFLRPKGFTEPILAAKAAAGFPLYHPETKIALWKQTMRRRYPAAGTTVATDILRQRIAYSLLQIFVISQNVDALANSSLSVANYYDRLIDGAFGNFKQLLLDVSLHPMMGIYLSHLGNQKAKPELGQFPDENFAREVMQLFSIGLWELNQNGTRKLDNAGNPIPTYNNADITTFARVFTGINLGGPDNGADFENFNNDWPAYLNPMKGYDPFHDMGAKTLLKGTVLPAGQTTMQDINAALDNLVNHPNTGPFIGRLLIQRLVCSNPSPEYIGRVAAKFANNGSNIRGDMAEVIKQILLDPEARNFEKTKEPTFGKMREPYMTLMNMAKTFNAQPTSGDYESGTYFYDLYLQEPFQSPSVFNFYSPNFRPPGPLTNLNKYAPEFQILTAVTAVESQNNLLRSIEYDISRWGQSIEANRMIMKFDMEIPMAVNSDQLLSHLSTKLIGGKLTNRSFQLVREAIEKIPTNETDWQLKRIRLATYLIGSSAEFNIQK
jgi:uncharacterized protein (DUF1800 family)